MPVQHPPPTPVCDGSSHKTSCGMVSLWGMFGAAHRESLAKPAQLHNEVQITYIHRYPGCGDGLVLPA